MVLFEVHDHAGETVGQLTGPVRGGFSGGDDYRYV